jgi:hypothetical protein
MAVAGILNSVLFHATNVPSTSQQSKVGTFQQLGQDLQSGNLSAAQSDFAVLTQNALGNQLGSANTINQAFNTLGQDLQSGNLAAAQRDYATLRQDLQQNSGSSPVHHHHHHHGGGSGQQNGSAQQTDPISVAFGSLGQALQSGNLAAAQQAYSTIQADLPQFASSAGIGGGATSSTPGLSTNSGFAVNP